MGGGTSGLYSGTAGSEQQEGGQTLDFTGQREATGFPNALLKIDFPKHKKEFKNPNMTEAQYNDKAKKLLNSEVGGDILGFTRDNGRIYRYNKKENEFGICEPNGEIACFYRPTGKLEYWYEQEELYGP